MPPPEDRRRPPDDETETEVRVERDWRPRPKRLLIGLAFIAAGIVWSILAARSGPSNNTTPIVVHGPVETHVQTLDSVRVRPTLPQGATVLGPARMQISFHNDGGTARLISPDALRLHVAGGSYAPAGTGSQSLHATVLRPGAFVTASLRFTQHLAPGATLVFAPTWGGRHSLRWQLWR